MKKTLILIIFISSYTFAQAPAIQWQKALGGTSWDVAYSIQQTSDGGYIVAGDTYSNNGDVTGYNGGTDYWVIKLNANGVMQWQKTLGGTSGDLARSIQQTADGGFIVAGSTISNDGDVTGNHGIFDFWIVKLNSSGVLQWQKTLGGTSDDFANSIQKTSDGGYIVAGITESTNGDVTGNHGGRDYWVVKLNASGVLQWQKTLGGTALDEAYSIQQTADGGYIVAGNTISNDGDVTGNHGESDYWVVKLNANGVLQWQKTLGGTSYEWANSIQQISDGGFIIAGYSGSNDGDVTGNHGGSDYWVVKINNLGILQWQKTFGGTDGDEAYSIQQTSDGGYILAGFSGSNNGDVTGNHGGNWGDYWIVKLNVSGVLQWQKTLGGTSDDQAHSLQITSDGGFIVAGKSDSNDGDVTGNHGADDYWVIKLASDALGTPQYSSNDIHIYPNPANDQITIDCSNLANVSDWTIKVVNTLGQEVYNGTMNTQQYIIPFYSWSGQGVYFVKIYDSSNNLLNTKKIILQ